MRTGLAGPNLCRSLLLAALGLLAPRMAAPRTAEEAPPAPQQELGEPSSQGALPEGGPTHEAPWRVSSALFELGWLQLQATHRTRYERLWRQFREGVQGHDMALSLRTTLFAELRLQVVVVGAELADSRVYLADQNTPVDTTLTNALELLQGYVGASAVDVLADGAKVLCRAGRVTMDVGSRRLVARNRFRNTINAFTGLDLQWWGPSGDAMRIFVTLPIHRRPARRKALLGNAVRMDRERTSTLFWGLFFGSRSWSEMLGVEAYLFGLREQDAQGAPSKNRRLLTSGLRLYRQAARGTLDLGVEAVIQVGKSRASTRVDDHQDLDHLAFFAHGGLGYTFDVTWAPRLVAQYDYASGDPDPHDDANGRFDTLFGARRFEFGPTGIYGAIARSNINAPGIRFEAQPHRQVRGLLAYRPVWLAQSKDAWTTAGIRDPRGALGSFVGHQVEARLQWQILPGNMKLESGVVHTWLGRLASTASGSPGNGDPSYVYVQMGVQI